MILECLHPYVRTNSFKIDPETGLPLVESFPCGKCIVCKMKDARDWVTRISIEHRLNNSVSSFITLTYDNENLFYVNNKASLSVRDLQLFFKRLRKRVKSSKDFQVKNIRFYAVGEYGPNTSRPHYHVILFGLPAIHDVRLLVEKSWNKGFITIKPVNKENIFYIANYSTIGMLFGAPKDPEIQRPFRTMSRNNGIGFGATSNIQLLRYYTETQDQSIRFGNSPKPLPRYLLQRFFVDEESLQQIRDKKVEYLRRQYEDYISMFGAIDAARAETGLPTVSDEFQQQMIDKVYKAYQRSKLKRRI